MRNATHLRSMPLTKARVNLGSVVKQAYLQKKSFLLEKGGIPVAGILGIEDFEDWLELSNPSMRDDIQKGYREYKKKKTKPLKSLLAKLA
ncbi:hypothetical protein HY732_01235 [Candidatus Uhrbacteria bacterium]|nr:hypothetical protein [Candidatus Uhrbacteria bacterium]